MWIKDGQHLVETTIFFYLQGNSLKIQFIFLSNNLYHIFVNKYYIYIYIFIYLFIQLFI